MQVLAKSNKRNLVDARIIFTKKIARDLIESSSIPTIAPLESINLCGLVVRRTFRRILHNFLRQIFS